MGFALYMARKLGKVRYAGQLYAWARIGTGSTSFVTVPCWLLQETAAVFMFPLAAVVKWF